MRFQYQELSEEPFEIRLLTIAPAADPGETIFIDLINFPLGSAPEYLALSYTWDRPNSKFPIEWNNRPNFVTSILVNGREFHIRPNLFWALWSFRMIQKQAVRWWVDAICIN
jgi:hypothetical protein